ncbi:hypothetical protein A6U85_31845 [Agrobacterium sp. 13-626]|jgi:flavin-dependent dehydrogenase|nr:hypothetical protein A6U85_31845 [Agrobacterium sp. 13-626]
MAPLHYDVAIFGAGPSALCAAILLVRDGGRVICIEGRSPRVERPGETLPGAAVNLLRRLALPFDEYEPAHRRLTGISTAWSDRQLSERDHICDPNGPSWLVDRSRFDGLLRHEAERAGVSFLSGPLSCLEQAAEHWTITLRTEQIVARDILDATGRAAAISRRLGARRQVVHRQFAHWAIAGSQKPRLDRPLVESNGQEWWFAINLPTNRTFACLHTKAAPDLYLNDQIAVWQRKFKALEWLSRFAPDVTDFCVPRVSDASGSRLDVFAGSGWLSCGDAAMTLDPLSSQGLFSAIATAEMAARSISSGGSRKPSNQFAYQEALEEVWTVYDARLEVFDVLMHG